MDPQVHSCLMAEDDFNFPLKLVETYGMVNEKEQIGFYCLWNGFVLLPTNVAYGGMIVREMNQLYRKTKSIDNTYLIGKINEYTQFHQPKTCQWPLVHKGKEDAITH